MLIKLSILFFCKIPRLLIFAFLLLSISLFAQDDYYVKDRVSNKSSSYNEAVKSIQLTKYGLPLSHPEIQLNSNEKLLLSFDVMGHKYYDFNYSIYLCDHNWNKTELQENEYLEGFNDGQIRNYNFSFNRLIPYINYNVTIPDDMMRITKSGNYMLVVYPDNNKDSVIFTRRFIVYEDIVTISAKVKEAISIEDRFYKQNVDFSVNTGNYYVMNPYTDIKVVVRQNNRWDNTISNLKPKYVKENQLVYQHDYDNIFNGSNEYRFLDIKSLRYRAFGVNNIIYGDTIKVNLIPEASKRFEVYSTQPDIDGGFIIKTEDNNNSDTESEYVLVKFFLQSKVPIIDGGVYVTGGFTEYAINDRYKMLYNYKSKMYELELLLKQGYYNYFYAFLPNGSDKIDETYFEGNHRDTRNMYSIYVYHTDFANRHDRIIGILKFTNGR